jgi:alpha-galactosidase
VRPGPSSRRALAATAQQAGAGAPVPTAALRCTCATSPISLPAGELATADADALRIGNAAPRPSLRAACGHGTMRAGAYAIPQSRDSSAGPTGAAGRDPIRFERNPSRWYLGTASSLTVLVVGDDGTLLTAHEGAPADPFELAPPSLEVIGKRRFPPFTVPTRGGFPSAAPAIEVLFPDGLRDIRLFYSSYEITGDQAAPVLRITLRDELYPLEVTACFGVRPQLDIIERWLVIENRGDQPLVLENAASTCVMLEPGLYDLLHLTGRWGDEATPLQVPLRGSAQVLESRGMRFHHALPFYMVRPSGETDEEHGATWFGTLAWSGNWVMRFEPCQTGGLQILGGISFWDTTWRLAAREAFVTPVMVTGHTDQGCGGASRRLHRYIRRHVLPANLRDRLRPVGYNSWFATLFDVDADQQIALARQARELGVELFVTDDGWFSGRRDDRSGLGDWWPDRDKFPEGLAPVARAIRDLGLEYGIWVEPEMVNPGSELHRAHPEWVLQRPGSSSLQDRNQVVLNMAREDVQRHTIGWLTRLLEQAPISVINWDCNRDIAETGSPGTEPGPAREMRIRYVQGVYAIADEIRRRFPRLMIHACAGGGGRADVGLFARADKAWISDNTNPADRLHIQYGWSYLFPANTLECWTTEEDWREARPSLEYRFRAAMQGILGIGNDLRKWGAEERALARREIALYKRIRPVIQQGDLYRLVSPFSSNRCAIEYVAEDRSAAVVLMYNIAEAAARVRLGTEDARSAPRGPQRVRLRGLDAAATYDICGDLQASARGETLVNRGIEWLPRQDYEARIVILTLRP